MLLTMNKRIVVFAGFSLTKYVHEARSIFPPETHKLVCVYKRNVNSDQKKAYLALFDETYAWDKFPGDIIENIEVITCTQERDMEIYIALMEASGKISEQQASLWTKVINKRLFKETMREIDPAIVPYVLPFDKTALENSTQYPFVIKPSNLMGSSFVSVIHDKEELEEYLKNIQTYESLIQKIGRLPELMIEEFISGPQYSMNVYINAVGEIAYCPLTRVIPAFEFGINDTYSAIQYTTTLPEDDMDSLRHAISAIVTTFGLRGTSAHFDCILSPTGWKICEVGLRIGGNRQELFQASHGFSHFKNDLYNRSGKKVDLGERKSTVAIVQKAPPAHASMSTLEYTKTVEDGVNFSLDKLTPAPFKSTPVSQGGATVFRAFLSGENEEKVATSAKELFDNIVFKNV